MANNPFDPARDPKGRFAETRRPDPDVQLDVAPTITERDLSFADWATASDADAEAAIRNPTSYVVWGVGTDPTSFTDKAAAEEFAKTQEGARVWPTVDLGATPRQQSCTCENPSDGNHDLRCAYRNARIRERAAVEAADALRPVDGELNDDELGDRSYRSRVTEQAPVSVADQIGELDRRFPQTVGGNRKFRQAVAQLADREAAIARAARAGSKAAIARAARAARADSAAGAHRSTSARAVIDVDGAPCCPPCAAGDHAGCGGGGCMCIDMDHDSDR